MCCVCMHLRLCSLGWDAREQIVSRREDADGVTVRH